MKNSGRIYLCYRCDEQQFRGSFILFTAACNPNRMKAAIEQAIHSREMYYGDIHSSVSRQIRDLRLDWKSENTIEGKMEVMNRNLIFGFCEEIKEGDVL